MRRHLLLSMALSFCIALPVGAQSWKSHDMTRPTPPRIEPPAQQLPVPPPDGATVLFGTRAAAPGDGLAQWTSAGGGEPRWRVEEGFFEVVPGTGPIRTRQGFGDVQLHVEWAAPHPPRQSGQNRGNSGVFLMGLYEIQVLDSYENDTYADGQAAAVYGQHPPLFNATRPPGEWQSYDIYFRRPRFVNGELAEPARVSVVHNGILVQNNVELRGPTSWLKHLPYEPHSDELPLELQDHGQAVRFRNIWVLPLPELPRPPEDYAGRDAVVDLGERAMQAYAGIYERPGQNAPITVTVEDGRLFADFFWRPGALELLPVGDDVFVLKDTDGRVVFERNSEGNPTRLEFHLGGAAMEAARN